MWEFLTKFPWNEFNDMLGHIYSARKKTSEGGPTITDNEKQGILESARTFYNALEGALK